MGNTEAPTEVGGQTWPPCFQPRYGGSINIIISMLTRDNITVMFLLQVNLLDNIASVKAKIKEVWDIPCINKCLIFGEKNLKDNCSLTVYNVQDKSTLQLIFDEMENTEAPTEVGGQTWPPWFQLHHGGSINIAVSWLTRDNTFMLLLQVNLLDSIASVKAKIKEVWDIPCINQCLVFGEKNLADNCSLTDYNVQDKSILQLIFDKMENTKAHMEVGGQTSPLGLQPPHGGTFNISVSRLTGDNAIATLQLQVNCLDSIASVKAKIGEKWDIPCINQCLVFGEKNLEDNCSLADYNVQDKPTLCLILDEVPRGTVTTAQQQKRFSDYYIKSAIFVVTILVATYRISTSAPSSTRSIEYIIFGAAIIADVVFPMATTAKWASAFVYLSSSIQVLIAYILLVSFNKYYGLAIIFMLPIAAAALREICKHGRTNDKADPGLNDEEVQHFDSIFDLASNIVINCGAIACFIVPYMAGAVKVAGFSLFFTIVLGIYIMAITTVRTAALIAHAKYLAIPLKVLRWITIISGTILVSSSKGNT